MKNKNIIITVLIVILGQNVSWGLWISQRGMKLRLIDKETKEPIKGALLINSYFCSAVSFDPGSEIYGTKVFTSDENGEITIPRYFRVTWPWNGFYEQGFRIYTIGYESIWGSVSDEVTLSFDPFNTFKKIGIEEGKQVYINKKKPLHRRIIDENKKIRIEENAAGYRMIVLMKEPLDDLEIQLVPIKEEEVYLRNLQEMGYLPWDSDINQHEDEKQRLILYIKNCDEFLKRYPNSKEKSSIIRDVSQTYRKYLGDNENAEKYYNMLDKKDK